MSPRVSDRIDELSQGASFWRPEDIAVTGAIVTIGHNGAAEIMRVLVRPEDKAALKTSGLDGGGIVLFKLILTPTLRRWP